MSERSAPSGLHVEVGRGQVTLRWDTVPAFFKHKSRAWEERDEPTWPDARSARRCIGPTMLEPERIVAADASGAIALRFAVPMPALSLVELVPED